MIDTLLCYRTKREPESHNDGQGRNPTAPSYKPRLAECISATPSGPSICGEDDTRGVPAEDAILLRRVHSNRPREPDRIHRPPRDVPVARATSLSIPPQIHTLSLRARRKDQGASLTTGEAIPGVLISLKLLTIPVIAGLRLVARRGTTSPLCLDSIRSVVLVEMTGLGDAVTTITLIRNLHDVLPQARIHLLVDQRFAALIGLLSNAATVHGVKCTRRPSGVWAAIRKVRQLDIDLACSVSPAHRNAAVVLSSRARFKAGYLRTGGSNAPSLRANPLDGFGFIPHERLVFKEESWLERRWKILRLLGLVPGRTGARPALPDPVWRGGLAEWRRRGILNGRPHIVVHPFSGWHYRSWPIERYLDLIERVVKEWNLDVIVLCAKSEEEGLRPFRARFGETNRVRCVASAELVESAVLVQTATALVGNDSGLVHLAAAIGTPAVGVYGPANPAHTAPEGVVPLYRKLDCSPCHQQKCVRREDPCMTHISVDEVYLALREILTRHPSSRQER